MNSFETKKINDEVLENVKKARENGKTIGLVQGSWDLFHIGHLNYLLKAKELCDFLVVAMDSDEKIKKRKGPSRPVIPEDERYEFLKLLPIGKDGIIIKPADEPKWSLIKTIRPDVLIAIKENYTDEEINELQNYCGNVAILPRQANTSTSDKIRKIVISNQGMKVRGIEEKLNKSIDSFKKRVDFNEQMVEPIPSLIDNMQNSTDWVTPVSAACFWNNKWYFGANHIDMTLSEYDIENRTELFYSCTEHAEINLLRKLGPVKELNTPIWTTLFPCDKCLKVLINKGVKEIYYFEDHPEKNWSKRSHALAEKNNIKTVQIKGKNFEADDMFSYKYIYPPNARKQEQLDIMMNCEINNIDPLSLEYIDQPVILITDYWYVSLNRFPYEGVEQQFLIVTKNPIYKKEDISLEMWEDFQKIWLYLSKQYNLPGGAFCLRFGDPSRSGASLKRIHAHLIVPKEEEKVKFSIGGHKNLKEGLILSRIKKDEKK